jgi:hypothetical protein
MQMQQQQQQQTKNVLSALNELRQNKRVQPNYDVTQLADELFKCSINVDGRHIDGESASNRQHDAKADAATAWLKPAARAFGDGASTPGVGAASGSGFTQVQRPAAPRTTAAGNGGLGDRIIGVLTAAHGPMNALEISKAIECTTVKDVNPTLYRLEKTGKACCEKLEGQSKPLWSMHIRRHPQAKWTHTDTRMRKLTMSSVAGCY